MLTLPQATFAFLALFLTGLTTGLTGFGLAIVATPLLILVLPTKMVVTLLALLSIVNNSLVLYESRRGLDLRRVWPLVLAGLAGVPLGACALVWCDVGALRLLIGVVVSLTALALLLGFRLRLAHERLACVPIGFTSGLLDGSVGMAGPPVVLFFANQGVEKQAFRANLAAYFAVLGLARIPSYLAAGLVTRAVAGYAALFLPPLVAGLFAGARLARRVNEQAFRRVVLVVVCGAGLMAVASGLRLL